MEKYLPVQMKFLQKCLQSLMLDYKWLRSGYIPLGYRVSYVFRKYLCLIRKRKKIKWLNLKDFEFDNLSTPATLQSYPDEIAYLLKQISIDRPLILDIGANVGQFVTTAAFLIPGARIFSFEPNPNIFDILVKNTKSYTSVSCFNLAVSPAGEIPFFYVPGYSGKGSFIKSNANINLLGKETKQINVRSTELDYDMIEKLNIPQHYDLIKIDVEGYEANVLDALIDIDTSLLYVEASLNREKNYYLVDLLKKMERIMGDIDLLYIDKIDATNARQTTVNILVRRCLKAKS